MKHEGLMYKSAGVIFVILLIAYPSKERKEEQIEHVQYCERVVAYEDTKHLPDGEILGHRNYDDRYCNKENN